MAANRKITSTSQSTIDSIVPSLNTSQQRISSTTSPTSTRSPSGKEKIVRTPKRGENFIKNVQNSHEIIRTRFGYDAKPSSSKDYLLTQNTVTRKLSDLRKNKDSESSSSSSSSSDEDNELAQGSRYKTSRVGRKSPAQQSSSARTHKTTEQLHKAKATDKVPYFADPRREEERLRKKYFYDKSTPSSGSRKRKRTRSYSRSPSSSRRRYRSYSNSSGSPRRRKNHSRRQSRRTRSNSHSGDRRRRRSYTDHRSRGRRSTSRSRSKDRPEKQYIAIPVPVEYPVATGAWMPPSLGPYGRNPFMLRPPILQPAIPLCPPIRQPYYNGPRMYPPMPPHMNPIEYLNRNMRFHGRPRNQYRPRLQK